MNSRLVRLMRRLSKDIGTPIDELLDAARKLLAQNPKLKPEQIDQMLRSTA